VGGREARPKRKAKDAVPAIDLESKRPNKSAVALAIASVAGVFTFIRKRKDDDSPTT
jgi:hypothetical protein